MANFISLIVLTAMFSFGQDTIDNGRHDHRRRQKPQHQQQQQSFKRCWKRFVITGDAAEKLYNELPDSELIDLSQSCSAPVLAKGVYKQGRTICFDRGEGFENGTRYKCYQHRITNQCRGSNPKWFEFLHNRCGGDGIRPIK